MTNLVRSHFQAHPFHLVSPSPWPIFTCISLLSLTTSGVLTMHGFSLAQDFVYMGLTLVVLSMSFWFRDVISEATYLGNHTLAVQRGLNMGVALFIVSEALFFLAIFWTFFHSALSPAVEMGAQWPPMGIDSVNPFELPLLNTVLLLSSGFTVTYAHHSLIQGNRSGVLYGLVLTVILALIFTSLQGVEYTVSSFTLSDSTYGSCFYFGTGFHGLTRLDRNCLHRCRIMKSTSLSLHWEPSSRLRIFYTVLTFCGCCMVNPLRIYLLLRILVVRLPLSQ
uniref:Cytochrome c oxidase subunit 3 n=1 Tax=Usnea subfusca TaxID=2233981 RepID=A0A346Q1B8_9LECA|nr:cytochrome c oxidase subunit III [Usnea subfusca]